jgi:putative DNA primase/helicase
MSVRFDGEGKKEFRPFHKGEGGWVIKDPPGKLPLFRLPELLGSASSSEPVFLPEGEKCVCALEALGLRATTSAHGAKGARKTDWEPLAGRYVVIAPDNDLDGREDYAPSVTALLLKLSPRPTVRILQLPGLPPKGDCVEWIEARNGKPPEEIRAELIELASKAEAVGETAQSAQAGNAGDKKETDEEAITRVAALSTMEYERVREVEAQKLDCRVAVLDSLVQARRLLTRPGGNGDDLQGEAVVFEDVEPWPEPVDGAEVLDEISATFSSYVIQPQYNADTVTLWSTHTHCFSEFQISPRLQVTSPEGECGKTTLRDLIGLFSSRPQAMENLTPAVLFRIISAHHPTILADEYDTWIYDNDELRGLFNAGHRKGGRAFRIEGEAREVRFFDAYAPTVLCGLGRLPGTLPSRSITIRLERASKEEKPKRFDSRHVQHEVELCRKLARWVADNRVALAACDPVLPEGAFNRVADNWRPLFAIAEAAGGEWPGRCSEAFEKLTRVEREDTESLRIMLLCDIREVFRGEWPLPLEGQPPKPVERIFSKDLTDNLEEMTERPWPEVRRGGKAITARWLASNLAAFGIHSKNIRIGEDQAKGYERAQFDKVFAKYIPETPDMSSKPHQGGGGAVPPSHTRQNAENQSVPKSETGTDEKKPVYEASGRWDASGQGVYGEKDKEDDVSEVAEPQPSEEVCPKSESFSGDLRL